jgi:hypothetical protein
VQSAPRTEFRIGCDMGSHLLVAASHSERHSEGTLATQVAPGGRSIARAGLAVRDAMRERCFYSDVIEDGSSARTCPSSGSGDTERLDDRCPRRADDGIEPRWLDGQASFLPCGGPLGKRAGGKQRAPIRCITASESVQGPLVGVGGAGWGGFTLSFALVALACDGRIPS